MVSKTLKADRFIDDKEFKEALDQSYHNGFIDGLEYSLSFPEEFMSVVENIKNGR